MSELSPDEVLAGGSEGLGKCSRQREQWVLKLRDKKVSLQYSLGNCQGKMDLEDVTAKGFGVYCE